MKQKHVPADHEVELRTDIMTFPTIFYRTKKIQCFTKRLNFTGTILYCLCIWTYIAFIMKICIKVVTTSITVRHIERQKETKEIIYETGPISSSIASNITRDPTPI